MFNKKKKDKPEFTATLMLRYYRYNDDTGENIVMERSVEVEFESAEEIFEAMNDLENVASSLTERMF